MQLNLGCGPASERKCGHAAQTAGMSSCGSTSPPPAGPVLGAVRTSHQRSSIAAFDPKSTMRSSPPHEHWHKWHIGTGPLPRTSTGRSHTVSQVSVLSCGSNFGTTASANRWGLRAPRRARESDAFIKSELLRNGPEANTLPANRIDRQKPISMEQ